MVIASWFMLRASDVIKILDMFCLVRSAVIIVSYISLGAAEKLLKWNKLVQQTKLVTLWLKLKRCLEPKWK
jgi:hypothetical protein